MSGDNTEIRCKIHSGENLSELLRQVAEWIENHIAVALVWDVSVSAVVDDDDRFYIRVYFQCDIGAKIE